MAVHSTQGQNKAARITQGGVNLMVMDCGINFIRFRIPDQVYCNKSQKSINILFKTFILQKINATLPFYTDLGLSCTLLACECYIVFMLKENICKCEWKPTTKYATKYICFVSFLHIHTIYLDLQACKKLAYGGVKAFDDYMCTSVIVKKCI